MTLSRSSTVPQTTSKDSRAAPRLRTRILRLTAVAVAAGLVGAAADIVALSFQAARTVITPSRVLDGATPDAHGLPFERVEFPSRLDGVRLRGWFIPGGPAAVLLAHGHAGNKSGMLSHARYLSQRGGYSVLLFDFRASGESDGDQATLGYREWQDLAGALDYVKSRPDVDPDRVGALGVSMGGATVLLLGEAAHELRAVVADSAFATGDSLVRRFGSWFNLPPFPFSMTVPLAVRYYAGLAPSDLSPLRAAPRIAPTPLFLIHGEEDGGIPAADAQALYQAAGEPKTLWVVPAAGHAGAYGTAQEEYEERVLEFFGRHLGPRG